MGSFCDALIAGYSAPMMDPRIAMMVALRIQPPVTTTRNVERWSIPARAQAEKDANHDAAERQHDGLAENHVYDIEL